MPVQSLFKACLPCPAWFTTAPVRLNPTFSKPFALLATFDTVLHLNFFLLYRLLKSSLFILRISHIAIVTHLHLSRICLDDFLDDPLSSFLPHTPLAVYIHQPAIFHILSPTFDS
jgi:hypothetical protein